MKKTETLTILQRLFLSRFGKEHLTWKIYLRLAQKFLNKGLFVRSWKSWTIEYTWRNLWLMTQLQDHNKSFVDNWMMCHHTGQKTCETTSMNILLTDGLHKPRTEDAFPSRSIGVASERGRGHRPPLEWYYEWTPMNSYYRYADPYIILHVCPSCITSNLWIIFSTPFSVK